MVTGSVILKILGTESCLLQDKKTHLWTMVHKCAYNLFTPTLDKEPKKSATPLIIRDCGILFDTNIDYSIIVATFPDPTVLPPSRQRTCVLYRNLGTFLYILPGIFTILLPVIFIYSDS